MTDQEIIEKATRIMASTPPADLIQALADAGMLADCHQTQRAVKACEELLTDLGKTFTRVVAERDRLRDHATNLQATMGERIHQAEKIARDVMAERDALAATVQRVRNALDRVVLDHRYTGDPTSPAYSDAADYIRAALDAGAAMSDTDEANPWREAD